MINLGLRVKVKEQPCIRYIEFLSTIYPSYIHWAHSLCYTNLAYFKEHIFALRSIYIIHTI